MDYGHALHFGVFIPPTATAAGTERVTVLRNVANLPLRHPAVLARSAASLDILSGGRVELGLGAGAFWDAIEALDGPRRSPREAVDALEEAIAMIRALWTDERTPKIDGAHYRLRGAKPGPFPVHDIGIWLGAYKPRILRLTGRSADAWLPSSGYAAPEELPAMNRTIDAAAEDAGRIPQDIKRLYNISGAFGTGSGFLDGPPSAWVEQLAALALTDGISGFILAVDPDGADLPRFAEEVAPAVRELVAAERCGPRTEEYDDPSARATPPPTVVRPEHLDVTAIPQPTQRFSTAERWDEATRPQGPAPEPGREYTEHGRADGRHLIAIHDHLRQELDQIRDLVDQVAQGQLGVGAARGLLNTMTMRQNNWTLGTYCESYCRLVATHHTIEDMSMFPRLRSADPRLTPVVDQLEEEHHVIAEVLEGVDAALVATVSDPEKGLAQVQDAVDLLTDTLLSHLSYEERELVEPLARVGLTGI